MQLYNISTQLCISEVCCNMFGSLTEVRNWANYGKRYKWLFVPLVKTEPFMLRNQWVSGNVSFFVSLIPHIPGLECKCPSNSEETQIIGHCWQVCPVAVLDLLFNHEHLDRSLEQHMAMNCLKYFISEVLSVFNDFCLAQTCTYKNKIPNRHLY